MDTIILEDLIPKTKEMKEIMIVVYKRIKDYEYVTSIDEVIEFVKKKYPDSYNLHCKSIYLLEGKSKKFYINLINAAQLHKEEGVNIYFRNRERTGFVSKVTNAMLFPLIPVIDKLFNIVLEADFNIEQISKFIILQDLVTLYLTAGLDVEFNLENLGEYTIINPYTFIRNLFSDKELHILKAIGRISNFDLFFYQNRLDKGMWCNVKALNSFNSLTDRELHEMKEKLKKYQTFRGYMNNIFNEVYLLTFE